MPRVLVIDDDAGLLQMVKLMLEREGYQPILAEGGEAGIAAALTQTPDMAVIDLMMPGISGYDVTRQLRANSVTAQMPILILTARSQPMDKQMALNAGANAFMSKPVSSRELTARIAEILSEKGTPPPPVSFPTQAAPEGVTATPQVTIRRLPIGAEAGSERAPRAGSTAPTRLTPPLFKMPTKQLPVFAILTTQPRAGGTTLAINLAFMLRRAVERVCLIDLNMVSGQIGPYLRLPTRTSWADLLAAGDKIEPQAVGPILTAHPQPGIGLIGSPSTPPPRSLTADAMISLLTSLTLGFQQIVVDINNLTPASTSTLMVANVIVAVVNDEPDAAQYAALMAQTLQALIVDPNKVRLVINHLRSGPGGNAQSVAKAIGLPISAELPYDPTQVQAIQRGVPTVVMAPDSPYSLAVQQLSRIF